MDLTRLNFDQLMDKNEKIYRKQHLSLDLLEQLTTECGKIKTYKDSSNKINSTTTFNNCSDFQKKILQTIYTIPRGNFYAASRITQKERPELGRLTPIPMYGLKRDSGVNYEDWDKKDKLLKIFLGTILLSILEVTEPSKYNVEDIRNHYTNKGSLALDAWPKKVKFEDIDKTPAMILGQLWLAYAGLRTSSMILDLENWDNMPKAYDAVSSKEELPWIQIEKEVWKKEEVIDWA